MYSKKTFLIPAWLIVLLTFAATFGQTSSFTYQGKLLDSGSPANGQFDLTFRLFDGGGTQIGGDLVKDDVQVTGGIFTVTLDFGASTFATGSADSLEIAVRPGASSGAYTTLAPRQQLTSAPYAIKSANSSSADTAVDSTQLGGVAANQYVVTTDPRMTDARAPTAGSPNYIQNTTTLQASNFNITGNGTVGSTLSGNILNAATQFNIGGNRVLTSFVFPIDSLYVGFNSGTTSGSSNSFVGGFTGQVNVGNGNSFLGDRTGFNNTSGSLNSFVGLSAGGSNTTGGSNSFFGVNTGVSNSTGSLITIIGANANVSAGGLTNATAIGANALVSQNNSLVLGSINGVNNATADTNVGIGTMIPSQRLDVFGDVRVGTGSTGCITNRSGSVIAGTCSSDLRFKKNVAPFGSVLPKFSALRPVYFDWRSDEFKDRNFGTGRAYGLIAQEVERAFPELVVTDESGYKAVNYSMLPIITIQAVKEQEAEIELQRQQIEALTKIVCLLKPDEKVCKEKRN